jgi:DNA-binding NarL/FixJ family response regulator
MSTARRLKDAFLAADSSLGERWRGRKHPLSWILGCADSEGHGFDVVPMGIFARGSTTIRLTAELANAYHGRTLRRGTTEQGGHHRGMSHGAEADGFMPVRSRGGLHSGRCACTATLVGLSPAAPGSSMPASASNATEDKCTSIGSSYGVEVGEVVQVQRAAENVEHLLEVTRHREHRHGGAPVDITSRLGRLPSDGSITNSRGGAAMCTVERQAFPRQAVVVGSDDWPAECQLRAPEPKCLIVDDCTLHRENLTTIFARHGRSEPALAWNAASLRTALRHGTPDIVLVNMDTRDSMSLIRCLKAECPDTQVIVTGVSEDDEPEIIACAEAGVAGYHLRAESLNDLLTLMSRIARGESLCSPRVSAILLKRLSSLAAQRKPEAKELDLTAREIQILRLLEVGRSNSDIASELCIALHTVKNHVHSVLSKLGVSTRVQAAALSRTINDPSLTVEELDTEAV